MSDDKELCERIVWILDQLFECHGLVLTPDALADVEAFRAMVNKDAGK